MDVRASREDKRERRRVDLSRLGTLRDLIDSDHAPFDIEKVRTQPHDPSLRD